MPPKPIKKRVFIIILVILFLLLLLFTIKPKQAPLKEEYTLVEILNKVTANYSKIISMVINFDYTWYLPLAVEDSLKIEIKDVTLSGMIFDDELYINTDGLKMEYNTDTGLTGKTSSSNNEYKYDHLLNWYSLVYETVMLCPMKFNFKEMMNIEGADIGMVKMEKEGYYSVDFYQEKNNKYIVFLINMRYGTVEMIKIMEKLGPDKQDEKSFYLITAILEDIKEEDGIYFPTTIQVKFRSEDKDYIIITKIKKMDFN
ncbi:MAG: hypothetical protein KKH98_10830 [Spirochaetes bacterium]|nr:hypothetical protein [Spirochaetota bacterium]